jgi:hypothetical protein
MVAVAILAEKIFFSCLTIKNMAFLYFKLIDYPENCNLNRHLVLASETLAYIVSWQSLQKKLKGRLIVLIKKGFFFSKKLRQK